MARRRFDLAQVPPTQAVRVAADCRYVLYINGKKIGIGPAKGSHKRYFHDTYEVADLLRVGRNYIAAEIHSPGRPTFSAVPVTPALWVELDGILGTDVNWQTRPDPSRRSDSPVYASQMGFSEWRDLRRECVGWQTFADREEEWQAAELVNTGAPPGGRLLVPRDIPNLAGETCIPANLVSCGQLPSSDEHPDDDLSYAERMQIEPHAESPGMVLLDGETLRFTRHETDSAWCILDFGRESFGTVLMDVSAPEGAVLDIGYGDALYHGRVKTFLEPYRFADRYILRDGQQHIDHSLHDRGFRYLQLAVRRFRAPVTINLRVSDRLYPTNGRASFFSSDPFLNRLWKMCATTLEVCANDTFVDCPWREQAFWVNDTLVVYPYYLSYTNDALLPARCLRLAADGQRDSGLIPSVYPSAEVEHSTFPSMAAIWTLMLADYYRYTGDRKVVRELLPAMEKALAVYQAWTGSDGLIPNQPGMWNFIEWASPGSRPEEKSDGTTSVLNLLVAAAFRAAALIHEDAGDVSRAAACRATQQQLVEAVTEHFWMPEQKCFRDNLFGPATFSQHPHAVALHHELLPEAMREPALAALVNSKVTEADFYFQHFTIDALSRGGRAADALASIRRLWREMVVNDSPTVWETVRGKEEFDGVGSLCHAFACAPLYFMQTVLLGVRPLAPGFAEFSLAPQSLDLQFARGTVPTPHGLISVSWERQPDETMRVETEVPAGTKAVLPSGAKLPPGHHSFVL